MANFKIAHDRTARFEGGYQCSEDDNGNWTGGAKGVGQLIGTNRGITAWELAAYLGTTPTIQEMKNLSTEVAEKIYKKNYWNQVRGDEILSQDVANQIYDSAVNMGVKTAIILTQRALGLQEVGVMTTTTLNLLNNCN